MGAVDKVNLPRLRPGPNSTGGNHLLPLKEGGHLTIDPQQIWMYYVGAIILAILLVMRRRPVRGMRLNMRGGGGWREKLGLSGSDEIGRALNVVFNYNGHSWDAFEVLGVPAGSSRDKVEEAYKNSLARVDDASKAFIEAAYRAIVDESSAEKIAR